MVMSTERRREQLREAARRHRAKKKLQRAVVGHPTLKLQSTSKPEMSPAKKISTTLPTCTPNHPKLPSPCKELKFEYPVLSEATLIHSMTEKRRLKSREASRRHREKLKAAKCNTLKLTEMPSQDSNTLSAPTTASTEATPELTPQPVSSFPPILPVGMAVPPQVFPQLSKTELRRIQSRVSSKKFREKHTAFGSGEQNQWKETPIDSKTDKPVVNPGIALGAMEAELVANLLSLRN